MTNSTASQHAFDGLGAIIAAAIAPQELLVNARIDECLGRAGNTAALVNWVWSRRMVRETSRQMGTGLGSEIVDFDREFVVEIVVRAGIDADLVDAATRADEIVVKIRRAIMPGPLVPDPTFGGIVRHFVSVGGVQDASEAFAGAARLAARIISITAHLRATGDPD